MLVHLYKQTLNRLNITYIVKEIKQKSFKELDVLMSQTKRILNIPETIIFIDKIEDGIKMAQYLQLLLLESLHKKGNQIIQTFSSTKNLLDERFLWKSMKMKILVF